MTEDPFVHYDAAYVLGALTPSDRKEFERHLATCPQCTQAVRELAGMPGLLARAESVARETPPPMPDTLLPRLLAVRDDERRRRRWWVAGVSAAAAAVFVLVLGLALSLSGGSGEPGEPGAPSGGSPPVELAFDQLIDSPVHAFGDLNTADWGTRIDINCTYDKGRDYEERSYKLVVAGHDGTQEQVAVWKVRPGQDVQLTGSTDLSPDQIATIDIVAADGTSLLRAKL